MTIAKHVLLASAGLLAGGLMATPAAALAIIGPRCVSVLEAHGGCAFKGNDAGPGTPGTIEALYNGTGKPAAPIALNRITKSDDPDFALFGSITGDGTTSGTWSLPRYVVDFISVKAANEFNLIKLATPASSGSWNTLNLCAGPKCNQPDLSHITFYGSFIPEPVTWAMLVAGFGLVGAKLRRRKGDFATITA